MLLQEEHNNDDNKNVNDETDNHTATTTPSTHSRGHIPIDKITTGQRIASSYCNDFLVRLLGHSFRLLPADHLSDARFWIPTSFWTSCTMTFHQSWSGRENMLQMLLPVSALQILSYHLYVCPHQRIMRNMTVTTWAACTSTARLSPVQHLT